MAISFNNIPSNIRVPLFYAEVDNSMANTGANNLKTLLIGQKTANGLAQSGKPFLLTSGSKGEEQAGLGSQLSIMNNSYRANDGFGEVWAIALDDPASGVAATGKFTVSSAAESAGTLYIYIDDERVPVGVEAGDDVATIAQAIASGINAKPALPVTASASAGVVTVTAKNKGLWTNDITLGFNLQGYAAGEQLPQGVGLTVTAMTGGNGTPDLAAAIKAMGDEEYDFIAMPYADADSLNKFKEVMNDDTGRWAWSRQIYGHVYSVKRGTVSELQSFGHDRNDQHATVFGIEPTMVSSNAKVLGAVVAQIASATGIDPARPLQTLELIGVSSAPAGERFMMTERQTLLTNGIATLYYGGGYVRIERAITTYQKNAFDVADTSYLDSETLHTLAYILRDLKSVITSKYPRHKLASDGTRFGPGQAIVTPSTIRAELVSQYRKLENQGIVENTDLFKQYLIVERNVNDPNRLDVLLPPDLVNGLRIFAVLAQFRLNY